VDAVPVRKKPKRLKKQKKAKRNKNFSVQKKTALGTFQRPFSFIALNLFI
jgi:hypothetical protein